MHLNKYVFLFLLLSVYEKQVNANNELSEFICTDGTQIDIGKICDGVKECPDGSDETALLCRHIICPSDKFRCQYGACVPKNSACNACEPRSQFQCDSNECIPPEKVCDTQNDCADGSDEHDSVCEPFACPEGTHRCKHGGCIRLDARCDGYPDCIDGSDESKALCWSLKYARVRKSTFCKPVDANRLLTVCTSGLDGGRVPCDRPMPVGTVMKYRCKDFYRPAGNKGRDNGQITCQADGTWSGEHLKCEPECGQAKPLALPLIVNGWESLEGEWPWHGTIYIKEESDWIFICGSTLISEKVVITAAHCTWQLSPAELKVALGKYKTDFNATEPWAQIMDVKEIIMQPLYQDIFGNYGSDIAVIVFEKGAKLSQFVQPVCLDWKFEHVGGHLKQDKLGVIVGMGVTETDKESKRLRVTTLPVIEPEKCIKEQQPDFQKYVTYTTFCAGWSNGTGVCNGDSGGGLVFPKSPTSSQYILQGIVSVSPRRLGTSLCDTNYYTIFTKVGIYIEWIQKVLETL